MEAYLSDDEAEDARDEFYKLFLTAKKMGTVTDVTFYRDNGTDPVFEVVYEDVLLTLAARQASSERSIGTASTVTQSQLAREAPFAPLAGDRFTIMGKSGRVIVVYPELNRVIRADIHFENPYG